jgi:DNA-binding CsgD family transcriptional regulator
LSEYAQAAGISINTAKTQMRQVFQRTGHDRQVDLIRAIAANPVLKLAQC